jgi:hypothetical protein
VLAAPHTRVTALITLYVTAQSSKKECMTYKDLVCTAQYSPVLFGMFVFFCIMVLVSVVLVGIYAKRGSITAFPWGLLAILLVYILIQLAEFFATCDPTRPLGTPVLGG